MKKLVFISILAAIVLSSTSFAEENVREKTSDMTASVTSPDGALTFRLTIKTDKSLEYAVDFKGTRIIEPSALGLANFDQFDRIEKVETVTKDETWRPVYGERACVRDCYNGQTLFLTRSRGLAMNLEVRAYNEGIAFRYQIPERPQGGNDLTITDDLTQYTFPEGTNAWHTPRAQTRYALLPLKNWPGESDRPLTLELPSGAYVALGEAQVVEYVRTKFALHPTKPNTVVGKMYQDVELTTPFATPWRVIMAASKCTELLANDDIYLNLNPPCEIQDPSWIKPGKVMRETTLSTDGAKALVDFAVKYNIQYLHFDAGWYGYEYTSQSDATTVTVDPRRNPNNNLNLEEAIRYAHDRGVGVIVYVNQRHLYKQLDEILPLYKKWGVDGIKFGFVHVGSFFWTKWMHDAIKKCADYQMIVDVHDEYRPTGFSRTYPNLMTQEGICGNEEMPSATHNTQLPFTRFVCGAADYTICYFHNKITPEQKKANPKARGLMTTSAHQLALAAVYYSPLQYVFWYDKPEMANDEPELEWFANVSTVWDDTVVVDGKIGEFAVVARKKKEQWFVGAITNDEGRDLKIPLDFLDSGKTYQARIYFDDSTVKTKTKVGVKTVPVTSETVLDVSLVPTGGQAIWIFEDSKKSD